MKTLIYILIASISLSLMSCEQLFFEEEPKTDPIALFEQFWNIYQSDYAPFEQRNIDWQATYGTYRPMVNKNTSDEELRNIFIEMLAPFNDTHIKFTVPEQQVYTPNLYYGTKLEDDHFSIDLIRNSYFTDKVVEYEEGWVVTSRIENIGYVWFKGISSGLLDFNTILDGFEDTDGMIIDLRHNGGGDMTFALSEIGRLFDEKRLTHRSKTINGTERGNYTDWFEWYIEPTGDYFDKPLVLLTDRYTVSAGERFTMMLKVLPNLVHMGDTTNGSLSTMIGKELPNGWYFTICPQIVEYIDGISYEGVGLIPDIVVENTSAEMENGIDRTLDEAIEYFKNK